MAEKKTEEEKKIEKEEKERKKTAEEKAQDFVNKQFEYHTRHSYKWLTEDIAKAYYAKALSFSNNSDVGAKRALRLELQSEYGVLEIEAINILNGYHINEYVAKYQRIRERIPTQIIRINKEYEKEKEDEDWKEDYE